MAGEIVFQTYSSRLLTFIREICGSTLGPAILTEVIHDFPQSFQTNVGIVQQTKPRPFLRHSSPSLFTDHPIYSITK